MRETVTLPKLGETVDEVVIIEWLVDVGEEVEADQGVILVETDKVETEVPASVAGTLVERLVAVDDEVATGEPVFVVETAEQDR